MIIIRQAGGMDIRAMAELLNEIVTIGGTTAITDTVTRESLRAYKQGLIRDHWCLAEDEVGQLQGFQWIDQMDPSNPEAAHIATFTRVGKTGLGIGSKLFAETVKAANTLGYRWISAEIRADNTGGLAYYQSRGFEDYGRKTGVTLDDGTIVDKILKRYEL